MRKQRKEEKNIYISNDFIKNCARAFAHDLIALQRKRRWHEEHHRQQGLWVFRETRREKQTVTKI